MARKNATGDTPDTYSAVSEEAILKIAKEIAVKFIEVGRLTPATFDETFKTIHQTIKDTVSSDD